MGVQLPSEPINRQEQYLAKIAGQAVEIPEEPITREEAYLDYIAKHGGGGGGGTNDYDDLLNQPKINNVTLKGNKSAENLGLASKTTVDGILNGTDIDSFGDVESALTDKADKSAVRKEFGGTLEQWNALTTEEKKEYDAYDITDDYSDGNYIYLPTIYSEEEREVGVWKDGKPLYQRTVEFNFTSNTGDWTVFDDSVSYDKFIQDIATTKGVNIEDQITSYQNASASPRWCVRNDHKLYYYLDNAPRGGLVTLQYTKTTDTAGSGTWTPTGQYAHHYSTDEQIIGTWIDGKTLYRKVVDLGALPNNTSKTVDSGVTNINVVSATGFSRTQSGEYSIAVPSPTTVNKNLQINMNQITGIITVSTADNYSDYTSSHLILEYTKSTT